MINDEYRCSYTRVRFCVLVWKINKILTKFSQADSCNIVGNEGEYANNNRGGPCVIVASSWQIEVVIVGRSGDDAEMSGIIEIVSGTLGKYTLSLVSSTTLVLPLSFCSYSWTCSWMWTYLCWLATWFVSGIFWTKGVFVGVVIVVWSLSWVLRIIIPLCFDMIWCSFTLIFAFW